MLIKPQIIGKSACEWLLFDKCNSYYKTAVMKLPKLSDLLDYVKNA